MSFGDAEKHRGNATEVMKCNPEAHWNHAGCKAAGICSSQPIPSFQSAWRRISGVRVAGLDYPSGSKVLAAAEATSRLVGV